MELIDYLEENFLTPRAFAKLCGLAPHTIYRILRGEKVGPGSMKVVFEWTQGKVDLRKKAFA